MRVMSEKTAAAGPTDTPQPAASDLSAPAVPAALYSQSYYLEACGGFDTWRDSAGKAVAGFYPGVLRLAGVRPSDRVIDVGTGRGEAMAVAVAQHGADWAVGIDYSGDALQLARRTLEAQGVADRCLAVRSDARAMPLPDRSADLALMLDIVEHLTAAELAATLREVHRVLVPGGRLFVHTMPTRTIYAITYRLQRALLPWRLWTWPRDPRREYEHLMHINEQTLRRLRGALEEAGFARVRVWFGDWVYTDHVPSQRARRTYRLLARWRLTRPLGVANLFAEAHRPGTPAA
jgi:ubiquinone/menaquinone biosynthesis C-methylase UbiE